MNNLLFTESKKALDKAEDALENAAYNLQGGFTLVTANRAYYSCYYCMSALLYTKDITAKSHQGIRAKFSEIFIKKSEIFPTHISSIIASLFDYRQEADYDLDADISTEEATNILNDAQSFYQLCRDYHQQLVNNSEK